MAHYSVLITSSPYDSQGSTRALAFCNQLIIDGHQIDQIFFYQSGIYNALSSMTPPSDEQHVYADWASLHHTHNIPLRVCVTAAEKRGVSGQENHNGAFEFTGMGVFFSSLHNSQQLVQF